MKNEKYLDKYILSMSKFLFVYYNIEGEVIRKLTHEQLNEVLDIGNISSNEIVIEDVFSGKVILVKDSEGIVEGYKNPLINKKDYTNEESSNLIITFEEKPTINIDNIDNCSEYELTELIKNCKKIKNDKAKKAIIKELNKRNNDKHSKERIIEKVRKREFRKE